MDSANHFLVVHENNGVRVNTLCGAYLPSRHDAHGKPLRLSIPAALNLAAWLVAMATEANPKTETDFHRLLQEVRRK